MMRQRNIKTDGHIDGVASHGSAFRRSWCCFWRRKRPLTKGWRSISTEEQKSRVRVTLHEDDEHSITAKRIRRAKDKLKLFILTLGEELLSGAVQEPAINSAIRCIEMGQNVILNAERGLRTHASSKVMEASVGVNLANFERCQILSPIHEEKRQEHLLLEHTFTPTSRVASQPGEQLQHQHQYVEPSAPPPPPSSRQTSSVRRLPR